MNLPKGLYYDSGFLYPAVRDEILKWLAGIYPIWEERYSEHHPPPPGQAQRRLLRPVYWLGNWQFACLNYYHPPHGIHHRCVRGEPFPPVIQALVAKMEKIAHRLYRGDEMPRAWHLNTCLVNFYGNRLEGEKRVDCARVGDHKDFEPGPVASLSLGERAFFQFVASRRVGASDAVVFQQWLEDGSLQIFGGDRWKKQLFHRVQRVEKRTGYLFPLRTDDFETRRVNLTFRYVPEEHIVAYSKLPTGSAKDIRGYLKTLARHSEFYRSQLSG